MAALNPVAPQNAALPNAGGVGQQTASPTMEQRLLDYISRYQAEGLAKGQHLSNPAALGGEALKSLKGYFERATALQESWAKKAQVMSENGEGILSSGNMQLTSLPGGPASARLEPAMAKSGSAEKVQGISDNDLERTVEALMQVMQYSVETTLISTATNNVSKSAMTLIRG